MKKSQVKDFKEAISIENSPWLFPNDIQIAHVTFELPVRQVML